MLVNRNVTVLSLNFAKAVETPFLTPPTKWGSGKRGALLLKFFFGIISNAYIFVQGEQNITSKKEVAKERLTLPVAKK